MIFLIIPLTEGVFSKVLVDPIFLKPNPRTFAFCLSVHAIGLFFNLTSYCTSHDYSPIKT
jgi:hypothetical protein